MYRCSRCKCKIPYKYGQCSSCKEIILQERIEKQVNRRLAKLKNTVEYGIGLVKKYADARFWVSTHLNDFRASFGKKGETDAHRNKKYERWCYHRKLGRAVYTELILKKSLGRPDLIVVDKGFVFAEEIIASEREDSRRQSPILVLYVRLHQIVTENSGKRRFGTSF